MNSTFCYNLSEIKAFAVAHLRESNIFNCFLIFDLKSTLFKGYAFCCILSEMNIFAVARSRDNKYEFFCIRYFSKTKSNPAKKTSGQCFGVKMKPTYKNSAIFAHFENGQKI